MAFHPFCDCVKCSLNVTLCKYEICSQVVNLKKLILCFEFCTSTGVVSVGIKSRAYSDLNRAKGFTLIELMISIGVLAIITTMAIPTFNNMILNQNLNKSTRELIAIFSEARAKAALERQTITVNLNNSAANTDDQLNWMPSGKAVLRSGVTQIQFLANGMTNTGTDNSFQLCDQALVNSKRSKIVTISRMGTVQIIRDGSCS